MDFKRITLSDKDTVSEYLDPERVFGSHQCFINMFIWQEGYDISYCIEDGFLCSKSVFDGKPYFIFPEGQGDAGAVLGKIIDYAHSLGVKCNFTQLSKEQADFIYRSFKGQFETEDIRDFAEYVYEAPKMIALSGKKLHSKRNFLNGFLSNYNWEYREISDCNISEVKDFCLSCVKKEQGRDAEIMSIHKLFDNFTALGAAGAAIYIDGRVIAATAGEMLTKDTAVIHLEKADTDFRGSYAAINNMFLKNRFPDVKYVNREEDMGIEGLRKAKLSYHPCQMVHKFMAREI